MLAVECLATDLAAVRPLLARYFAARPDILAAYVFGSVARGTAGTRSDVDVGIVLANGPPKGLAGLSAISALQGDLEALLGAEVDLVALNGAAPDLLHRVLRDGVLVHESDHRRRLEFELQALNLYFDLQPILELYRRTVLARL